MSQLLIIGDKNPEIGKEAKYTISLVNFGGLSNNINVFNPISEIPQWQILVLEHGKWRKTSENTKQGESVSYTFKQSSLSRERIKLVVTKGNDKGELIIKTKRAGQPKILKVDLLDVNYNKVTKPLHYFDTLIAKAQCTDMEGEKLHFTLWEDDALKEGHNKINEINKINPIPISATVKRGKAEARFNMAFYTQASMIANMQLAKGDKSEGKNHEYYVTAYYYGKLEASNNVNIVNPDFSNPIQKAIDLKYPEKKPQKPKVNKRPTPPQPAPKKDTYKTPITPKAKTKAPDPKGKILSVEFVDFLGKPYQNMKFGTQVKAKIISKDMKGKTIKLKIWEDDISDQLVYENNYVLVGDESYATLNLTNEMRKKGDDFKEGSEQEYFLEIEYAGQSVDSEVINVNDSAPKIKVETGMSTSGVKQKTVQKAPTTCLCQQYDLSWGHKFTCQERKKVIQICAELWGEGRKKEMANHLMNCMALETGEKFKPDIGYSSGGATGLVQWTGSALDGMNKNNKYNNGKILTKKALANMTVLEQLDYVKLYFKMWIDAGKKINDSLDLYMCIWCPAAVGKEDSFVCYSEKNSTKNYNANQSIDGEYYIEKYKNSKGKIIYNTVGKTHGDGEITKGELRPRLKVKQVSGIGYKETNFTCESSKSKIKSSAKDIVTFHIYADGKIEKHIPKSIKEEFKKKYKYTYHDKNGKEHNICIVDFVFAQNWIVGSKKDGGMGWEKRTVGGKTRYFQRGNGEVELVKIIVPLNYNKDGVNIKIGDNTDREYINPKAFASMLGAVAECGYNDFIFNGSTSNDGTGAPSVTHVNGVSFDFRYLRKDKTGNNLYIDMEPNALDIIREEKFIDALVKFGYSKFYSYNITVNGKPFILKNSSHLVDHNHHLHIRREGYNPKYKEVKQ